MNLFVFYCNLVLYFSRTVVLCYPETDVTETAARVTTEGTTESPSSDGPVHSAEPQLLHYSCTGIVCLFTLCISPQGYTMEHFVKVVGPTNPTFGVSSTFPFVPFPTFQVTYSNNLEETHQTN